MRKIIFRIGILSQNSTMLYDLFRVYFSCYYKINGYFCNGHPELYLAKKVKNRE